MKKLLFAISFSSLIILFGANSTLAQDTKQEKQTKKEATVKELIDAQHYTFEAQTAMPVGMRSRQLTSSYELKVRKDTVDAYLPYYGKAYVATIGSSDGGIQFKATDFQYTVAERKKGGWNITIVPKNAGDTRQLFLTVSVDGIATLQVNSNNKQSISFYGYIQ